MWSKLKEFIKKFASLIISVILLIALIVVGLIITKNKEDQNKANRNPEIAQVFEPSISTPLPPDVNQEVKEEQQPTESNNNQEANKAESTGAVAGVSTEQTSTTFVAPPSGLNPTAPIPYQNQTYGFSITLPAYTTISEQDNLITFGNLFFVSIVNNSENLEQISIQLSQSPDAKNIQTVTLSGNQALKFNTSNGTGYVVTKNDKTYYLIGQDKYLTQVKI